LSVIAELFRDWLPRYERSLRHEQRQAVNAICKCRTPAMKHGSLYLCPDCGQKHFTWHSCGNRNCPQCGCNKVAQWLEKRQGEMLPVNYYMVTFTLPHEFNYQCKVNPKEMFNAFFKSSSAALKQVANYKNILNGNIGMMGTLQTWARDGSYHVHIHYIVPGVALEDNKETLRFPKNPAYLMPMQILQKVFKAKIIDILRNQKFYDSVNPKAWRKDWIVHCQSVGNGQAAIKYLSAYTQKIFISSKRIEYDGENVTYSYIDSNTGQKRKRTVHALNFISLYLQHVLPSGFMKTRRYGLMANATKVILKSIRELLEIRWGRRLKKREKFAVNVFKCKKCSAELKMARPHLRAPPKGALIL
jgi:Putative transposase/Transposase zinc-binding domain